MGWILLQYTQPVTHHRSVLEKRAIRPVAAKSETVDLSDKRQALVIGNSDYAYAGMLANPVNDANTIGKTL